ncbi:hypothetical protein KQH77_09815 [Streptococcus sanguinis]|uniref:hypothetical protein n=1 Tax=Streptococcus sanguinis TaxID=1305 RepID=UPI000FB7ECD8|nr:hypothetical protein [Streptococcus sanguinis]RSI52115.1 hypothetical protein D8870_08700 [Streptococcus sanguinis]
MSTSVTNPSKKRFRKTALIYALLTIFFFAFSRIYESFSFGETSSHMHYLFVIPLAGGILLLLFMKIIPNLSRLSLSLNLWNSAVAIMTTGMLFRGIVNLSGRSTTLDMPYWYLGAAFAALALLSMVFTRSEWNKECQAQPIPSKKEDAELSRPETYSQV